MGVHLTVPLAELLNPGGHGAIPVILYGKIHMLAV